MTERPMGNPIGLLFFSQNSPVRCKPEVPAIDIIIRIYSDVSRTVPEPR